MASKWDEPWRKWKYVRWSDIPWVLIPLIGLLIFDARLNRRWFEDYSD